MATAKFLATMKHFRLLATESITFFDLDDETTDAIGKLFEFVDSCIIPAKYDLEEKTAFAEGIRPHIDLICDQFDPPKNVKDSITVKLTPDMHFTKVVPSLDEYVIKPARQIGFSLVADGIPEDGIKTKEPPDACGGSCSAPNDIARHGFWIKRVIDEAVNVEAVCIIVYLKWYAGDTRIYPDSAHGQRLVEKLDKFVHLEKLQRLEVRKYRKVEGTSLGDRHLPWAIWTKENGWLVPPCE